MYKSDEVMGWFSRLCHQVISAPTDQGRGEFQRRESDRSSTALLSSMLKATQIIFQPGDFEFFRAPTQPDELRLPENHF